MFSIRIHKYLPMACIIFFINGLDFFPHGLLITMVLSPVLYLWLLLKRCRFVLIIFLAATFPFALANLITGMEKAVFIVSFLVMLTTYVPVYAIAVAIRETHSLDHVLRTLIWMNLAFAFVGLLIRFTPLVAYMWQFPDQYSPYSTLIRFRGLTYEASYYTMLLMPLMLYSYWRFVQKRTLHTLALLTATTIPLLMSQSYSGIVAFIFAVFAVHLIGNRDQARFRRLGQARLKWILGVSMLLIIAYAVLPSGGDIKMRAVNIVTGNDASANLRTAAAYVGAYAMARSKDIWFGIGLGETKNALPEFMGPNNQALPSVVADTFAELGLFGLVLRFGLEIYFFVKTRPDRDPFRFSLFLWVFIIQFCGSSKNNLAEYVVWILAFSPTVGFFSGLEPAHEMSSYAVPQLT